MRLTCSLLALAACGSHAGTTGNEPDAGATGDTQISIDATCGGQHLDLAYVPPNLMFVLDRSCSMKTDLAGTTTSKWQAAATAVAHVLTTYATKIRWGATLFPDTTGDACSQDAIPIPIANGNAAPIASLLLASTDPANPLYPDGPCVTNIDTGVEQAATDPALDETNRKSYLMLVTDGGQSSCSVGGGNAGTEAAVKALHDTRGIDTFVVGFGSEVKASELDTLADLGGRALAGTAHYYQADTATDLDQAFAAIADSIVSCSYKVSPAPANLDETYVVFDGTELVPRDSTHATGWDFDAATDMLTLYGTACTRLKTHAVTTIDVTFGCPSPPIL